MKFIMVVIICFGVDCQAVYQMYPQSSGEVHCFDEHEFSAFQKMLEDGGKPTLTNPDPVSGIEA